MKQRLREMDFIRAVSALSIIVIHVTGLYAYTSRGAYYLNQVVRYAVPLFILLSGLLIALSGYKYEGISGYFKFLGKRLKKVYIPYFIWSMIYIVYMTLKNDTYTTPSVFFSDTVKKLFYGTGYLHLYFVIIIVQLYFLCPLLMYFIKKWTKATLVVSFLITLVYQTGVYIQLLKVWIFPMFIFPNYVFFPTWIFYFVLGMYFAIDFEKYKNRISGKAVPLAAIWAISFILLLVDNKYTNTFSSSIKPTIMIYTLTSFFFMYSIALKIKDSKLRILNFLDWTSYQSFTLYFSHLMVMNVIRLIIGRLGFARLFDGFYGMLVFFVATVAGTCLFAWFVSLTPFASILGGVKNTGKKAIPAPEKSAGM